MLAGDIVIFLCLFAGGTSTALAAYAWFHRKEPGSAAFAALMTGSLLWALTYAVALVTFDPALRHAMEIPLEVAKAIIAPAWLVFALRYTGHDEFVSRRFTAAILVFPAATIILTWADPAGLLWTDYRINPTFGLATVAYDPGPWFYLHAIYGFVLIGAGLVAIFDMLLAQGPLYREQAVALVIGSVVPAAAYLKRIFRVGPAPQLDLTPIALAVTGLAFSYALFRFDLFGLVPATRRLGRRAVIDDIEDAILIVDVEKRVIDANDVAETLLSPDEDIIGAELTSLLEHDQIDLDATPHLLELDTGDGWRTFEVRSSEIRDQHDRHIASTVTMHDVTDRESRRQRLEVLNRVLRHNLRNDMTVILGNAELLAEGSDGAERQAAETIIRQASELSALSERAREIEEVMGSREQTPETFDAADLLERIAAKVGKQYPDAEVEAETPLELPLHVRKRVFEAIIENLIDNALAHNDADEPWVSVRLLHTGDELQIEIEDNGPGLPPSELAVLEEGAETPLEHGSGMGLWLVTWGIQSLGGEVDFEGREPRGTRAVVTLPAALLETETNQQA